MSNYVDSEEYKRYADKSFKVLISCKTIEQWQSAIKFVNLVEDYLIKCWRTETDKVTIISRFAFYRGFASGMIQALKEKEHEYGVKSYLELGC